MNKKILFLTSTLALISLIGCKKNTPEVVTHIVTFDYNFQGASPKTVTTLVEKGKTVAEPQPQSREDQGFVLDKWRVGPASTSDAFDFTTPIVKDIMLYASWINENFVSIQHNPSQLVLGREYTYSAKTGPEKSVHKNVTFSSSDDSVLSINETTGKITIHKTGDAIITCKNTEFATTVFDSVNVTVYNEMSDADITKLFNFTAITDEKEQETIGYSISIKNGEDFQAMTSIIIPEKHDNKPILTIGNFAWRPSATVVKENRSVKTIVIPNCATSIIGGAFQQYKGLQYLELGTGIKDIGAYSFQDNNIFGDNNKALHIPESVNYIYQGAFSSSGAATSGSFEKVIFDGEKSTWRVSYINKEEEEILLHEAYDPTINPTEAAGLIRSFQDSQGNWFNPDWVRNK